MVPARIGGLKAFTLIELMIVIAVIGILAAIAYPSYIRYVERTQFNDGQAGLMIAAQELERCYVTSMEYDGCTVTALSPEGFYSISATTSGQTYVLCAQGETGHVAGDNIWMNQAGGEPQRENCP